MRNPIYKGLIEKQIYIEDLVFTNPISPGDQIILPHFKPKSLENSLTFWCNIEKVCHSPEPESRSYLEAEYASGSTDFDRIEKFLLENYESYNIQ